MRNSMRLCRLSVGLLLLQVAQAYRDTTQQEALLFDFSQFSSSEAAQDPAKQAAQKKLDAFLARRADLVRDACSFWGAETEPEDPKMCRCKEDKIWLGFRRKERVLDSGHCGVGRSAEWGPVEDHARFWPAYECQWAVDHSHSDCLLWSSRCSCLTHDDLEAQKLTQPAWKDLHSPAINFCSHLFKAAVDAIEGSWISTNVKRIRADVKDLLHHDNAEAICQAALTNTWKPDGSQAMKQMQDMESTGDVPTGQGERLERIKRVSHRSLQALTDVCHDECHAIVEGMVKQAANIANDMLLNRSWGPMACADFVVKKAEANVLGCCAKACGWNGAVCMRWPFLNETEQDGWLGECCAEHNIMRGSERSRMCNSVEPAATAELTEGDLVVDKTPWLSPVVGQDEDIYWTEAGAKTDLGKIAFAETGSRVHDSFLSITTLSLQEGILLGLWSVEKKPGAKSPAASPAAAAGLAEIWTGQVSGDGSCNKDDTCPDNTQSWTVQSCARSKGWQRAKEFGWSLEDATDDADLQVEFEERFQRGPSQCAVGLPAGSLAIWTWPQGETAAEKSKAEPCEHWKCEGDCKKKLQSFLEQLNVYETQDNMPKDAKTDLLRGDITYVAFQADLAPVSP
ncbi:unnamed protein product [Symbiodinium microadriaticum]|nr:unnamed protein product [Symbiodinium microadriaticum]